MAKKFAITEDMWTTLQGELLLTRLEHKTTRGELKAARSALLAAGILSRDEANVSEAAARNLHDSVRVRFNIMGPAKPPLVDALQAVIDHLGIKFDYVPEKAAVPAHFEVKRPQIVEAWASPVVTRGGVVAVFDEEPRKARFRWPRLGG